MTDSQRLAGFIYLVLKQVIFERMSVVAVSVSCYAIFNRTRLFHNLDKFTTYIYHTLCLF